MSGEIRDPRGQVSPDEEAMETLHDDDSGPEVSPLVVDAIGRALHSHFKAIAEMPLPDRFMVLLAELEARERSS